MFNNDLKNNCTITQISPQTHVHHDTNVCKKTSTLITIITKKTLMND